MPVRSSHLRRARATSAAIGPLTDHEVPAPGPTYGDDEPTATPTRPARAATSRRGPGEWDATTVTLAVPDGDPGAAHELLPFLQRKVARPAPPPFLSPGAPDSAPETTITPTSAALQDSAKHRAGSASTTDSATTRERGSAMVTGLRWTIIGRPAVEAASLLGVAVLARLVAPAEFGRYAIALIVLTLANVPTQAVQYSIVQRKQIDRDHLQTGVSLTILIGLAVCGFCFAASYTLVPIIFGARTALLVRLMIPACFINSVNTVQIAIITRRLEFRRLSLLDITITLVGVIVSIPLAVMGLNGESMVFGVLAGSLAGLILVTSWVLPPMPSFRVGAARDLLRPGLPAASSVASMVCFQNCDYVIVGARLGALQAGYYFRAYTLGVTYQTKISQVLYAVGFPVLSRATSADEVDRLRKRMIHTITLILFPLLTALAIIAPRFVTWFYGPAWRASILPVQILTIGGAAMLVAEAVTVAMLGSGRPRAVMWWGWGHFVVYGAAVFAVARLGLPAIAAAAAVVHTGFLVVSYIQLHHGNLRRAFRTLAKDLLPATVCSAAFAAVAVPTSTLATGLGIPTLPYLLLVPLAGGFGYVFCLRLCFPGELRHLAVLVRRLAPARTRRLFGRVFPQTKPQSAI